MKFCSTREISVNGETKAQLFNLKPVFPYKASSFFLSAIVCFPFLRVPIFVQTSAIVNTAINGALIVLCVIALASMLVTIGKGEKMSPFFFLLVLFQISPLWSTVLTGTFDSEFIKDIAAISSQIAFCWFIYVFSRKSDPSWLAGLNSLLWVLIVLNFFAIVAFPSGLYHFGEGLTPATYRNWVLGYDNAHAQFFIYGIAVSALFEYKEKGVFLGFQTILLYAICLISTIIVHAATSLLAMFALGLIFLISKVDKKGSFVNIVSLSVIYAILWIITLIIVCGFVPMPDFIQSFLTGPLDKATLFAQRPQIWNRTIEYISQFPILGNGLESVEIINLKLLNTSGPHNEILGFLYEGGILRLTIFIVIYSIVVSSLFKHRDTGWAKIVSIALFGIGILQLMRGCDDVLWLSLMFFGYYGVQFEPDCVKSGNRFKISPIYLNEASKVRCGQ